MRDLLYLKDDQIKDFIEQIFYAYRETYSDPKKILKKYSFGTAHHRAIHLIEKYEGLTVSDLLNKLKITKQSLNRVLRDLVNNKAILLKKGEIDSRQRKIFLNEKGKKLFEEIHKNILAYLEGLSIDHKQLDLYFQRSLMQLQLHELF